MESPSEHDDSLRACGWRQVYERRAISRNQTLLDVQLSTDLDTDWEPAPGVAGVPRVVETRFEGGAFYLLTVRWVRPVEVSDAE